MRIASCSEAMPLCSGCWLVSWQVNSEGWFLAARRTLKRCSRRTGLCEVCIAQTALLDGCMHAGRVEMRRSHACKGEHWHLHLLMRSAKPATTKRCHCCLQLSQQIFQHQMRQLTAGACLWCSAVHIPGLPSDAKQLQDAAAEGFLVMDLVDALLHHQRSSQPSSATGACQANTAGADHPTSATAGGSDCHPSSTSDGSGSSPPDALLPECLVLCWRLLAAHALHAAAVQNGTRQLLLAFVQQRLPLMQAAGWLAAQHAAFQARYVPVLCVVLFS